MNTISIIKKFPDQDSCIEYLEKIRWPDGPVCPHCCFKGASVMEGGRRHKCHGCNRSYSVLVGTVFQATKLPLQKWFLAIGLMSDAKKGISSLQLSRHLDINKDTAWSLQRRIRSAMRQPEGLLTGLIEVDETYVGGKASNMSLTDRKRKVVDPTGMRHMETVLGMCEHRGQVVLQVIEKACQVVINPILQSNIDPKSILVTDGSGSYRGIERHFRQHVAISHRKKQHSRNGFSMSTIEGFWAMVKRAVTGTYHHLSAKYLQEYLNEIAFKFNQRWNKDKFGLVLRNLLVSTFPFSG